MVFLIRQFSISSNKFRKEREERFVKAKRNGIKKKKKRRKAKANESERSILICFYPSTRALNSEKFDSADRVSWLLHATIALACVHLYTYIIRKCI